MYRQILKISIYFTQHYRLLLLRRNRDHLQVFFRTLAARRQQCQQTARVRGQQRVKEQRTGGRAGDKATSPADAEEAPNRRKRQIFLISCLSCRSPFGAARRRLTGSNPRLADRATAWPPSHLYLPARRGPAVLPKHHILVGSPVHIKADYRVDETCAKLSESRHTAYYF